MGSSEPEGPPDVLAAVVEVQVGVAPPHAVSVAAEHPRPEAPLPVPADRTGQRLDPRLAEPLLEVEVSGGVTDYRTEGHDPPRFHGPTELRATGVLCTLSSRRYTWTGQEGGGASVRRSTSSSRSASGSSRAPALISGMARRTSRGRFTLTAAVSTPSER